MSTRAFAAIALAAALLASFGACNSGTGDCPAIESVKPGGSCSDEHLQCPYDLPSPAPACDGTSTTLQTSCTCTSGTWACPSAVTCPGNDAASGDDASGGDDAASGNDAGGEDGAASDDASDAAHVGDAAEAG